MNASIGRVLNQEDSPVAAGCLVFEKDPIATCVHKVIITGGDRADIVLSALQTNVTGIILTGNLFPDLTVISAAKEKKVPLILVPYDTYTTASMVENTVADLQLHEAEICKELVEKHVDVDAIIDAFSQ